METFTMACNDSKRGTSFEENQGRFSLDIRKKLFYNNSGETLEKAAHRCGCPCIVQGQFKWGLEQTALVKDNHAYGTRLDEL